MIGTVLNGGTSDLTQLLSGVHLTAQSETVPEMFLRTFTVSVIMINLTFTMVQRG